MDKSVSITKGIAIILMVVGHAGCPNLLSNFIYAFHMPLFFFISGYLFKDKHLSNAKGFAINKIKGLYIPFLKWCLIFLLLHNIFTGWGLYQHSYSINEIGYKCMQILLMIGGTEQLLGGYWFIVELFYVSFWAFAILYFIKLIQGRKKERKKEVFLSAMCLLMCFIFSQYNLKIPKLTHLTLMALTMFFAGYNLKNTDKNIYIPIVAIGCFILCIGRVLLIPEAKSMGGTAGWQVIPYSISAVAGVIWTMYIATLIFRYLPNKIVSIIEYIGNNTMYILTFHFLSFRLVHWYILHFTTISGNMYDFPVIPNLSGGWWVIYSIFGVVVPLIIKEILESFNYIFVVVVNKYKHFRKA